MVLHKALMPPTDRNQKTKYDADYVITIMCVFVVSAARIHKANVSPDSLLSSLMPRIALQSLEGLTEKTHHHTLLCYGLWFSVHLFTCLVVKTVIFFFFLQSQCNLITFSTKKQWTATYIVCLVNRNEMKERMKGKNTMKCSADLFKWWKTH